mgnify:CR=1 FL=1
MAVQKSVAAASEIHDIRWKKMKQAFGKLHQQDSPLILSNVWDVASAKVAEKLGFQAIGTSSGAIATSLGYADGEEISFAELKYIVGRITSTTNIPLTVDLEAGYSRNPLEIADHILQLQALGIAGINIEDSLVGQKRYLLEAHAFKVHLEAIVSALGNTAKTLFINVRTDTFLLNHQNPIQETILRAHQYEQAGASGLFVPCMQNKRDIQLITQATHLPINVMCMPELPSFSTLHSLGIKRISMGNFIFNRMLGRLEEELKGVLLAESFEHVFQA